MQGRRKSDGLRVCLFYIQHLIPRFILPPRYSSWIIGRPVSLTSRLGLPAQHRQTVPSHAQDILICDSYGLLRSSTSPFLPGPDRHDAWMTPRRPELVTIAHDQSLVPADLLETRSAAETRQQVCFFFQLPWCGGRRPNLPPCLGCKSPLRYPLPISSSRQHGRPIS